MSAEKKRLRRLPARPGRDNRFSGPVSPPVNFRATEPTEFERLKDQLLREQIAAETCPDLIAALRRAANDAAAVAWTMPFPALVLPELFREKVAVARRYAARQSALRVEQPTQNEFHKNAAA
jgi:hypothetical protein